MIWPDGDEAQELLKGVERHDPGADERLWARYREPLRRMIGLRLDHALARRADASDIVQEVLLRANQRLPEYLRHPALPFHLWLRQIARDHLVDQHRKHRVAAARSLDREQPLNGNGAFGDASSFDLAAQLRDAELTPAAAAIRREVKLRFHAALAKLDGNDREMILLRHFEQLTNGEAARALGLSEPAAGMRHLRALRRLRDLLGETPSSSGASRI